jgi:RNA polymerase sigma factor (TIGR02999 family)
MDLPEAGRVSDPLASDVTRWLAEWRNGDERALERLLPLVYGELRRLASRYLDREREGHTLHTHDLIHEAFLRLVPQRHVDWQSRAHFFAVAAQMMRRILVDHARRRQYDKHGGTLQRIALDEIPDLTVRSDLDFVELDEALAELAQVDASLAQIVDLRFFGGLEHGEIASVLGVSKPTVQRRWRTAKAWLYRRLQPVEEPHGR